MKDQKNEQPQIEQASFMASFPLTSASLTFRGDGSMKIVFEVPANEVPNALPLTMWNERVLRVVVTPLKKDAKTGWRE